VGSTQIASAQNYSGDARAIALGGIAEPGRNAANFGSGDQRGYTTVVLPIGLFQILKNRDIYDPSSTNFDPIRAVENAASPLHFTINRNEGDTGEALVHDLVNGQVSRNLSQYRGFVPASNLSFLGLLNPRGGFTFHIKGSKTGESFHGVYIGVGPYVSLGSNVGFDPTLLSILSSPSPITVPNAHFSLQSQTTAQAAGAATIGYRGHIPLQKGSLSTRDGLYVAVDYNYLYGVHYDVANVTARFDTDAQGLLIVQPTTIPMAAQHQYATKGRGDAVDIGAKVIRNRIEVRATVAGIGNRIDWQNFRAKQYSISSLVQSFKFVEQDIPAPTGTLRVTLPKRYSGGVTYNMDKWSAFGGYTRGLNGNEGHGGYEYHLKMLDLRGGAHYVRGLWQPAGGVGLNLTKHFGVDFATFGTATNIQNVRKATMAVSLRFMKENS
jgi:hypothetical protein